MSKHKAAGKTGQHISPAGKRLGVKTTTGTAVAPGAILVRQSGTHFKAGEGVRTARDHSLYAVTTGKVKFGQKLGRKYVSVV
jgi:large subunit ribosomal protein L27